MALPRGSDRRANIPGMSLRPRTVAVRTLKVRLPALADGKDFGDGQLPLPVHRRHAHLDQLAGLHPVPVAVVDLTFDLEAVGIVEGQQGLPRLGQVPHRDLTARPPPRPGGPDDGVALHGGGFPGLGLGRAQGRLGALVAGLHALELPGAGRAFLEEILKALIIGAGLVQLRLGLGHPGLGLVQAGLVFLPGQGDQGRPPA